MNTRGMPNILFIYADQLRADMLSCMGNRVLHTPSLDRIGAEGVTCTQAFSSFPLCTPFRASLLTGKYNHSTGVFANHHPIPVEGQQFLPQLLRDAGYRTGYVGKWHLEGGAAPGFVPPGERRLGFESLVGFNRGHYYQNSIYFHDDGKPRHCPRFEPDFQTEQMIAFMAQGAKDGDARPFFGFICYGIPHFPFNMPDHLKNLFDPRDVPLGPTALDRDQKAALAQSLKERGFPQASGVWGVGGTGEDMVIEDEAAIREYVAQYYGMTANLDWNVGRLLNWLDAAGLAEDTLVVFFSDHGDMCGEHGYRCGSKKTAYRQAAQVPVLARWPRRFFKGTKVDALVDFAVDAMPTVLEACGVPIPAAAQGASFLALLEGKKGPARDAVYYEINKEAEGPERFPIPERGVRTKDWLYVRTQRAPTLLCDLRDDPDETRNLVGDPRYAGEIERLDGLLAEHMRRTGDDWSAEAVFPPADFLDHETKTVLQRRLLAEACVELAPGAVG